MKNPSLALLPLLCAALTACGGGGGGGGNSIPSGAPGGTPTPSPGPAARFTPPPVGAFLGAFVNDGSGNAFSLQIATLEQGLVAAGGRNASLATHLHFYSGNPNNSDSIVNVATDPTIADDYAHGRIPVVTWTCADKLSTIASGADDATLIVPAANALKALPGVVLVRWFHEFELNLTENVNASGGTPNGQFQDCFDAYNPAQTLAQNAPTESAEFVAAWQHIHAVFAQQGVRNVVWVWNPGGAPSTVANDNLMEFFPGSTYVDWIAGDFYDKPQGSCNGTGLVPLVTPFYNMIKAAQPSMPIMMTETGEDQSHTGCATGTNWTQAQYFADLATYLPTSFPQIKAVEYFDAQGNAPFDWTLAPGSADYDAFANLGRNPYFVMGTGTP